MMALALVAAMAATGCGAGKKSADPVDQVAESGGLRDRVRSASAPTTGDFPAAKGRSLQQVADGIGRPLPTAATGCNESSDDRERHHAGTPPHVT